MNREEAIRIGQEAADTIVHIGELAREVNEICNDEMAKAWSEIKGIESMPRLTKLIKEKETN